LLFHPVIKGLKPTREPFKILLSGPIRKQRQGSMSSLPLKRIRFAVAALLVAPLTLLGQAAVEYALRSAQSVPLDSSATIAG